MNLLLDPNVAYLILVGGFLLAGLALLAPGTGVLEISALLAIVLAGYAVYNIPINTWALVLLILGVFPFLIALRRSRRWIYLVISLAALVIGSAFLFRSDVWWRPAVNPLVALVVSALSAGFIWIASTRILEASQRNPSLMRDLVGMEGEAKTPVYTEGTVYVGGENWSAHSAYPIPAEARIKVLRKDGLMLEVEQVDGSKPG